MGETCAVDERMRFVMAVGEQEEAFSQLCRRFVVSRKTGYKWPGRSARLALGKLSPRMPSAHRETR
jgi:hypothetical protein